MKRTELILSVSLVAGIGLGITGIRVLSAQSESVKRTVLVKTDLAGIKGKEGVLVLAETAPGMATGKHSHPAHEFDYVLEGSGTLEVEGKPSISMKAGTTIYQLPKQVHNVKNASTTAPLKVVLFFIADKGQPLTIPVE